jgi:acyl-CoA thioester hydrolase
MAEPLVWQEKVLPDWIDYNGHLSEPYYVLVFGNATTALMEHVGMDEKYRTSTGCSLYTVEAHVRYLHEVKPGADLEVRTWVLGLASRKVRICHEMRVGDRLVATEELMALQVSADGLADFPATISERLATVVAAPPEYAGRSVGMAAASRN